MEENITHRGLYRKNGGSESGPEKPNFLHHKRAERICLEETLAKRNSAKAQHYQSMFGAHQY